MKRINRLSILKILKVIIFWLLCIIIPLGFNMSCTKPPYNYVINPLVVPDGFGGNIIVYQQNNGKGAITNIQYIGPDGGNRWADSDIRLDPSQPADVPGGGSPTELVGDGKGNSFVIWGTDNNIWLRKFDINGRSVWKNKVEIGKTQGIYKLRALSDGHGGVITGYYGMGGDFWLQKVNGDGKLLWTTKYQKPNIAGFDFLIDSNDNILLTYITLERSIYLQQVDLFGRDGWGSPILLETYKTTSSNQAKPATTIGLSGCTYVPRGAPDPGEYTTWIIDDDTEGCIVGCLHNYGTKAFNVYKIDNKGNIIWTKAPQPPSILQNRQITSFGMSRFISDGTGGIFILWNVFSKSNGGTILVQDLDFLGNESGYINGEENVIDNTWNSNGFSWFERIVGDKSGLIVTWASAINDPHSLENFVLRAQRLGQFGNKEWAGDGISLPKTMMAMFNQSPSITVNDQNGFFIIVGGTGSVIWKIGTDGKLQWERRF
jgi:hypothetical protein